MKLIKSKFRSQLTNQHLKKLIRNSISNYQKLISIVQIHKHSTSRVNKKCNKCQNKYIIPAFCKVFGFFENCSVMLICILLFD